MKKFFILIIFSLLFFSCQSTNKTAGHNSGFDKDVIQIVNDMSLRQKIGQVLLINFRYCKSTEAKSNFDRITNYENYDGKIVKVVPLNYINDTTRQALEKYHLGNVILFAENFISTDKAIIMISSMQNISVNNGDLPLIIGVDQEGGRVNRIFQTTTFPPAAMIAETKNPSLAYKEGQYIAEQLNAFGINMNYAPVCDVNSNPTNPVIGNRSFSSDPETAGTFAIQMQKGSRSKNVIPCIKHFPGHGDTSVDSHIGLPVVHRTKSEWQKLEAVPFKMNIEENIPVIMTAHIQYPGLDNSKIKADKTGKVITRPATLSKKILTGILRGELKYNGVICTDALDMKAISSNFSESQAVIEALNAGADMICNPISIIEKSDLKRLEQLYTDIENAIKTGRLSQQRLDNACMRIVQLKKDYDIINKSYINATQSDIRKAQEILSNPKYEKLKTQILGK